MRRALRWTIIAIAALAGIGAAGLALLSLFLDADALRPRLAAAVEQATGRAFTAGPIALQALPPGLTVQGATLANFPNGSRPEMARIARVEASLALAPLLTGRLVLDVSLRDPDILLETDAEGRPNWVFARPARPPAEPSPEARPRRPREPLGFRTIHIAGGRLALHDARTGLTRSLDIAVLDLETGPDDDPVAIQGRLALGGVPFDLAAETGPLRPAPDSPWPIKASLTAPGTRIAADATFAHSVDLRAWQLALSANIAELGPLRPALAALGLPGLDRLPEARGVALTARLAGEPVTLREGRLTLGATDLAAFRPGLALASLTAELPAPDQPLNLAAEGTLAATPLRLSGTLGPGIPLRAGSGDGAPLPLDLALEAAGARATLRGRLAQPRSLAGADITLGLEAPDLAPLSPLAGHRLPAGPASLSAHLADQDGLLRLTDLRIAAAPLEATGALDVQPGPRPRVTGRLAAARLDLDALNAARAAVPPAAPGATPPPGAAPAAPGASPPPPPAAAPERTRGVIPDWPLPPLPPFDAALDLTAATLVADRATWRDLATHLTLSGSAARLDPFAVTTPGGPVAGSLALEGTPPSLHLVLRSEGPGLDLTALQRARGERPAIQGHLELDADLAGRGATLRQLAATATGELGLALVNGRLDNADFLRLGPDLMRLLLPAAEGRATAIACFALRARAEDGLAHSRALLLETDAGRVEGTLALNLRDETIAARLLPDIRAFGVQLRAPVGVGGSLARPRIGVDPTQALTTVIGDTIANRLWRDPTIDWLAGRLTGRPPEHGCAAQLALARAGRPGPVPAETAPIPAVPRELQDTARDVLRGLLGGGRR